MAHLFLRDFFMSKILILGGDDRMVFAYDFLKEKNIECDYFNISEIKKLDLSNYNFISLPIPTKENGIPLILKNQILITGNFTPDYKNYIDICKRKDFMLLNAVPTAEAAISIAIKNVDRTLWNSKILIIGNGCIGKILSNRLRNFCKNITITARKSDDFSYIEALNFDYFETKNIKNIIKNYDIIFNTVPYPVVLKDEILMCKRNCVLIELSSAPFGIDKNEAINKNIKYIYAPALPGKYFPKTAGEILGKCIKNIINENPVRSDG